MITKDAPIQIKMKPASDVGPGSFYINRPTRTQKLYDADLAIFVYKDGKVEIGKNKNGPNGDATIEKAIEVFSKTIADIKLKNTQLDMFKEGLSKLLQEAIKNTLEGDYYERTICG